MPEESPKTDRQTELLARGEALLGRAADRLGDPPNVLYLRGVALKRLGRYAAAVETFERLGATDWAARLQVGYLHYRMGRYDESARVLSELAATPQGRRYAVAANLAWAQVQRRDLPGLIDALNLVIELTPGDVQERFFIAVLQMAEYLHQQSDQSVRIDSAGLDDRQVDDLGTMAVYLAGPTRATPILQALRVAHRSHVGLAHLLRLCEVARAQERLTGGGPGAALAHVVEREKDRQISVEQRDQLLFLGGYCAYQLGQYDEALRRWGRLAQAERSISGSALLAHNLALVHERIDDAGVAGEWWGQLISALDTQLGAREVPQAALRRRLAGLVVVRLADARLAAGDEDGAVRVLEEAAGLEDPAPEVLCRLFDLHYPHDRFDDTGRVLDRMLACDPDRLAYQQRRWVHNWAVEEESNASQKVLDELVARRDEVAAAPAGEQYLDDFAVAAIQRCGAYVTGIVDEHRSLLLGLVDQGDNPYEGQQNDPVVAAQSHLTEFDEVFDRMIGSAEALAASDATRQMAARLKAHLAAWQELEDMEQLGVLCRIDLSELLS